MQCRQKKHRLTSIISLVLILIPILALTAYASSPKKEYSFSFNGASGSQSIRAQKTDVGESTDGAAGISILGANFGSGSVRFWVNGPSGYTITNKSGYYNSLQSNISLIYYEDAGLYDNCYVTMYCQATAGVQGVGGNFQP